MKTLFSLFKTLFFVIPIVILTRCGKESDTADVMAGHAVVKYVVPDTLILGITTWTDRPSGFVIASEFDGEHVSWEKEGNSRFDYFASLNHDEGYDFYATWEMPPACPYPVKCLSVVSDADFDEQHPTGAELCDLADICVYSMGEFVLSGYRGENVEDLLFKPFLNVPRVFLPAALKGCVDWARENNVELITEEHMKIINDKRSKEKKK